MLAAQAGMLPVGRQAGVGARGQAARLAVVHVGTLVQRGIRRFFILYFFFGFARGSQVVLVYNCLKFLRKAPSVGFVEL